MYQIFMYAALVLQLFLIFTIGFYFICTLISELLTSGVPFVPTYNSDIKTMKEKLQLKSGKTMIDLGCGNGKALRFFTKEFDIKEAYGYDLHIWAILWGKLLNKMAKIPSIRLFVGNFLKVDFGRFDYVYVYLLTSCLEKIEDHVFDTMGDHTIIISNTFKFKNHTPFEVIRNDDGKERIFLYRKNN